MRRCARPRLLDHGAEGAREVGAAVVGEQAAHLDPVRRVEGQGAGEEGGRRRRRSSSGELLGVGEPRGVVDGHVHEVPADAAVAVLGGRPTKRQPPPGADAPQLLGVEVHEVAGARPAVAHHRLPGLQRPQTVRPGAAARRRRSSGAPVSQPIQCGPRAAQRRRDDAAQQGAADALRRAAASRGASARPAGPSRASAPTPLARRLAAHPGRLPQPLTSQPSPRCAGRAAGDRAVEARVTMSHEGPPSVHGLRQPQTDRQGPSPVNNVDGLHSRPVPRP